MEINLRDMQLREFRLSSRSYASTRAFRRFAIVDGQGELSKLK